MSSDSGTFDALAPGLDGLVVVVTHNSAKHIQWCIDGLRSAKSRLAVRIVDSGSDDTDYLELLNTPHALQVIRYTNVGFVAANNLAIDAGYDAQWVLFLNPDARVEGLLFDEMLEIASQPIHAGTGMFTVPLVRFDIEGKRPLDIYDSVGIECTWYGRWRDVLSGQAPMAPASPALQRLAHPTAVCGAFMLVRNSALVSVLDSTGRPGFERKYHMYKEDIELSLRLRRSGWSISLLPRFIAYHCRGWNKRRTAVPYWARAESARNDLDIALRYRWRAVPFAVAKLLWVMTIERLR